MIALVSCVIIMVGAPSVFSLDALGCIDSDSAAVETANRFTGIGQFYLDRQMSKPTATAHVEVYVDSTTPNLHQQLNGRAAWKVSFPQFETVLCSLSNVDASGVSAKRCDVWLDSATGQLLQVDIRPSDTTVKLRPPSEAELAQELSFQGGSYLGLPDMLPQFGMHHALAYCGNYVARADQIIIRYVMVTPYEGGPTPYWVVHMSGYGYPKEPSYKPHGTTWITNSLLIMSALSGDARGPITIRTPVPVEEAGDSVQGGR
jgi:hypothetical protein